MKVLVILGSSRDQSNTLKALQQHLPYKDFSLVELHRYHISHYQYSSEKPQDDFLTISSQMAESDMIVFATPVYWYSMSGTMKVFFDRLTDLITTSKPLGRSLKGKSTFLFSTGSDDTLPEGFEVPFQKTSEYFGMEYKGSLYISVKS